MPGCGTLILGLCLLVARVVILAGASALEVTLTARHQVGTDGFDRGIRGVFACRMTVTVGSFGVIRCGHGNVYSMLLHVVLVRILEVRVLALNASEVGLPLLMRADLAQELVRARGVIWLDGVFDFLHESCSKFRLISVNHVEDVLGANVLLDADHELTLAERVLR